MASHKAKPSAPGKKPEAKKSNPSKPAEAFRSAEFIEDSEDEATKVAKKAQTPKTTPLLHSSTKLTKPKAVTFTTKPSKKHSSPSPSPEKEESTQSDTGVDESSHSGDDNENDESSSAQDGSPTPTKPKATAARPTTNSAAAKALVRKSESNKAKASGTHRSDLSTRTASPSENEKESEVSGDESGSESESSDRTSGKASRNQSPTQKHVTPRQESIIFAPPPGFESASIVVHPSSQVADLFSPTNLAGKEIWHIAAPSSVPMSTIKELSQQKILSRSSILSYRGSDYGLIPDSSIKEALLLPSVEDNEFKSHSTSTLQSFHLQQVVSLPHHSTSPAKSSNQGVPTPQAYKRAPREQPQGLKMRYHPFGVVDISDKDLSNEHVPKVPQFRMPGVVEDTPSKKRKRLSIDHGIQSPAMSSSKVKPKKAKIRQEITVDKHDDVIHIDTVDQPASQKPAASKAKANGALESHTPKSAKSKKTKLETMDKRQDLPSHQPSATQSLLPADIAQKAEIIMPEEVVTTGPSAVEITASEDKKAKRKRKKMEATKTAEVEQDIAKAEIDVEMRDADESPSRQPKGQSATPAKNSAQKHADATNGNEDEIQQTPQKKANAANGEEVHEVQATPTETKEERRKRKEEKRKRKREGGKV